MKDFKTLQKLKDKVVLKYLDEVNFEEDNSIYEVLLRHLFTGDFDTDYTCDYIDNYSEEERLNILKQCRGYSHLCLIYNDYSKFDESINSHVNDKDFIVLKLFENFDFIIKLFLVNKDILDELSKFENNLEVNSYSVIETLRDTFSNDDILIECLNRMVQENKFYDMFSCERRSILYNYPIGLLYIKNDDNYIAKSVLDVATYIYNYVAKDNLTSDEIGDNPALVTQISKFLNGDLFDFKETIAKISDDYYASLINV